MFQSSCAEKKKQITAPFLLRETAAAAATTRDNKQTNKQTNSGPAKWPQRDNNQLAQKSRS